MYFEMSHSLVMFQSFDWNPFHFWVDIVVAVVAVFHFGKNLVQIVVVLFLVVAVHLAIEMEKEIG